VEVNAAGLILNGKVSNVLLCIHKKAVYVILHFKKVSCQKYKLGVLRHLDLNYALGATSTFIRKRFITPALPIGAVVFLPFEKVENCIRGKYVPNHYAFVFRSILSLRVAA
jgi:hypothetical protein